MLRLKDTRHDSTLAFLDAAIRIAGYYGFSPLDAAPARSPQELRDIRGRAAKNESEIRYARREERLLATSARKCATRARGTESLLVWRISDAGREKDGASSVALELHIVGNASAIAEALLLVVADAIVRDAGITERILHINSIGSPESSNRYVRDVGSYLRKHLESISTSLRPRTAIDPVGTLVALIERGHPAIARAPQATEYLTEDERKRFWDVLEYLEVAGLPYELSPHVLGSRDCWQHSLFQLSSIDRESGVREPVAFGGRYDPLASRFAAAALPAAMISIACETNGTTRPEQVPTSIAPIYFAHLGIEARRRSLPILEQLRGSGIAVYQGLTHERLGDQMAIAHKLAMPYILIMGHKEAVEGTVLVREVATNSQEPVALPDLPGYLKRHRMCEPRLAIA